MTEQRPSSAYLGPEKGRWAPHAWSDVVEAAAGGLLDESHWVDLKQELPAGKRTHNTELAQDLASLAIDGGLLVVGIEDHDSRAGKVCGVELARIADRVDQVARDKVRPSLGVPAQQRFLGGAREGRSCSLGMVVEPGRLGSEEVADRGALRERPMEAQPFREVDGVELERPTASWNSRSTNAFV
jgi:hypothetical protein